VSISQSQIESYFVKHLENCLNNHIRSTKHKDGKGSLHQKEKRDQMIMRTLQKYNETQHTRGETLPLETEESAFSLSDRCFMSDHILFIPKEEEVSIKRELTHKYVSVINYLMALHVWERQWLW